MNVTVEWKKEDILLIRVIGTPSNELIFDALEQIKTVVGSATGFYIITDISKCDPTSSTMFMNFLGKVMIVFKNKKVKGVIRVVADDIKGTLTKQMFRSVSGKVPDYAQVDECFNVTQALTMIENMKLKDVQRGSRH